MMQFAKAVLLASALATIAATAQAEGRWELLGTASFDHRPVRDTIEVGARPGGYAAIRMEVRQSDVEVLDLKVVYGNGTVEDISVRQSFKAGSSSRVIDLKGQTRQIQQIVVTYVPRGPAKIMFFGDPAAAVQAKWEQLGCKAVGFAVDRDVIAVGRTEGRFRSIRLRVEDAPIELFGLRVVYGNGKSESSKVNVVLRPGSETRAIDLAGEQRGITRVEMLYRSVPSFKGRAKVCVDGLQAK